MAQETFTKGKETVARELIQKFIKPEFTGVVSLICFVNSESWWHVHLDEEVPIDKRVAFLIR